MTHTNPLVVSGSRLHEQGHLFVQQTWEAGETFAAESRQARQAFGQELSVAGRKLIDQTQRSSLALGRALAGEAAFWRDLAIKTREAYIDALEGYWSQIGTKATSARSAMQPSAVRAQFLLAAHEWLGSAQSVVGELLPEPLETEAVETVEVEQEDAEPRAKRSRKGGRAPIRNYDQLTAKDVVGRIQRLSRPQATALLDYEQSTKNRATVVRAAKQRLTTAS